MITKKEKNKFYIINNLDKYIIDGHGNFIHTELELGDDNYYIENYKVDDFKKVKEKVIDSILKDRSRWSLISCKDIFQKIPEIILKEIDQWKIGYSPYSLKFPEYYIRISGEKINQNMFSFEQNFDLLGELGYRENCWKDYIPRAERRYPTMTKWQETIRRGFGSSLFEQTTASDQSFTPQEEQIKQAVESIQTQAEQNKNEQNSPDSSPTSPSSNQETTNSETSPSPLLTIDNNNAIKNIKNTAKDFQLTKQRINKLLANKKIKTTDLPKKYQNWVEQIKTLTTKKEINTYVRKLEQVINKQINKQQQSLSESKDLSFSTKLGIGVGVSLVITGIVFFAIKKKNKFKLKKRK